MIKIEANRIVKKYDDELLTQLSHTKKDHIDLIHQHFQL